MRLIDADAFAEEMKVRRENAGEWLREAKDHDTAVRADAVLTFLIEVKLTLDKIPTIDAVSVKHGEWITKGQDIFCSVCGEESAYTWHGSSKFSNYCPNCGASMDGGKDDE